MLYADDILKKDRSSSITKIGDVAKGTISGVVIGLVGGGVYAYFNEKKYVPCLLIGALIGGVITRVFLIERK